MKFLPPPFFRASLLPLLLLGLLSNCAVYDTMFHPHRLPTPKMDAATKAKVRAAEKARHKGLSLKATDDAGTSATATGAGGGDPAAPSVPAAGADEKKKTMSYGDLPEGTRIKYDKQGLVKKGMLDRLADNGHKLHHYDTRPLTPREASRENRKIRKKGHTNQPKGAPRSKSAAPDPALDLGPDPGPPPASPAAPTESAPTAPRAKKSAAPQPKADPTQPAPAPKPAKAKKSKVPVPKPDPTQPAPGQ